MQEIVLTTTAPDGTRLLNDVDVYADAKHGFTTPLADKCAKDNGVDLGYHKPSTGKLG